MLRLTVSFELSVLSDCRVYEQGDVAQLKNRSTGTLPVGAAGGSKSRFCLIATSGVSWHPVPAQLPIAVIRQPGKMLQNKVTDLLTSD